MANIEAYRLLYILLPVLLVIVLQFTWRMSYKTTLYSVARMVIQLCLIGYALTYIFQSNNLALLLFCLSLMLIVSSWIALRPIAIHRGRLIFEAITALTLVNVALLVIVIFGVLNLEPWYSARIVIPLAGMIFASGMNAISLFGERYFSEIQAGKSQLQARNTAFEATLIPVVNSLFAVGLVAIPGMMTGQILSGVSPLVAVRYQIMIMLMMLASTGLTCALFHYLLERKQSRLRLG